MYRYLPYNKIYFLYLDLDPGTGVSLKQHTQNIK